VRIESSLPEVATLQRVTSHRPRGRPCPTFPESCRTAAPGEPAFSFRWNGRKLSDTARRDEAVKGAEGKRLMYRSPVNPPAKQPHDGDQLPFWPA
jgi:hypothetical protein